MLEIIGMVVGTKRMHRALYPYPFLDEPFGALQVTIYVTETGLRRIILEGDSLVINFIN